MKDYVYRELLKYFGERRRLKGTQEDELRAAYVYGRIEALLDIKKQLSKGNQE